MNQSTTSPTVGLIGLGWMGSNFATRLLEAGVAPVVFDTQPDKCIAIAEQGAKVADSGADLVGRCDVVLTSLPSSDVWVSVAEGVILPAVRSGQVIVDLGTTRVGETRRLAEALAAKGAALLDAPVSGDPRQPVYMFVGGEADAFATARPVLEILAAPQHLTHGGPSGAGQILKGVNQLAMGLVSAAWLEVVSFATRQGIDAATVAQAVGGEHGFRAELTRYATMAAEDRAEALDLKFAELPYFLAAAHDAGIDLPLTQALFTYCDPGPRHWRDNMNRPYVSFWHMLHASPKDAP